MIDLMAVLKEAEDLQASDVHFTVGRTPIIRVKGKLVNFGDYILAPEDTKLICAHLMADETAEKAAITKKSLNALFFIVVVFNYNSFICLCVLNLSVFYSNFILMHKVLSLSRIFFR